MKLEFIRKVVFSGIFKKFQVKASYMNFVQLIQCNWKFYWSSMFTLFAILWIAVCLFTVLQFELYWKVKTGCLMSDYHCNKLLHDTWQHALILGHAVTKGQMCFNWTILYNCTWEIMVEMSKRVSCFFFIFRRVLI